MANDLVRNPRVIDTFGSNVTISTDPVRVVSVVACGYTTAKTISFIDTENHDVLRLECPADGSIDWTPGQPFPFNKGLVFDDSGSDLASGDFVFVFVV